MLSENGPLTQEQFHTMQKIQQTMWETKWTQPDNPTPTTTQERATRQPSHENQNVTRTQYSTRFLPDSTLTQEKKNLIDESSGDDSIPAETIASMIDQMKTDKREELIGTLQRIADRSGNIQNNAIMGILSNISPRRGQMHKIREQRVSKLDQRLARLMDEQTENEIKW